MLLKLFNISGFYHFVSNLVKISFAVMMSSVLWFLIDWKGSFHCILVVLLLLQRLTCHLNNYVLSDSLWSHG